MRALITGINGFVGRYLAEYLLNMKYEVVGTTRDQIIMENDFDKRFQVVKLDLNKVEEVIELLNLFKPDHVYHLAGQSSVKQSWNNIHATFEANVLKTINLFEGIRQSNIARSAKILTVGSSEEYGKVKADNKPIDENTLLCPISPYGITKANVYMLAQHYFNTYNMQVIHVRPFNHIGPRQSLGFVTSDFAYQVAQIEKGIIEPVINVGNLEAQRDFTDVRDIVTAYEHLLKDGIVGDVYNVCSGKPVSIKEILYNNIEMSICKTIEVREDLTRMRPSDFPIYIGDPKKIFSHTGWTSSISLENSLNDILNYWRNEKVPLRSF